MDLLSCARRLLVTAALCAALAGCEEDSPCEPGSTLTGSVCKPVDAAAPAMADAAPAGGTPDAGAPANGGGAGFDEVCTDEKPCGASAPLCMKQPGQPMGYCTRTGCDKDPSVCPAGWRCFNLGTFSPGLPHACMK